MGSFEFCRGIKDDLQRRAPHYVSDWTDICTLKMLSSSLFMFFTSMGPAITFSLVLSNTTDSEIGAVEVMVSTAICAFIVSVFFGQPLVIVGVTGPVSILTGTVYMLSQQFKHKFLPFYAWSQLWAALFHIILATCNACDLLKYVTRFSCEVFCILIAIIYIYTGIEGLVDALGPDNSLASGLLQFIITIGAAYSSAYLTHAKHWKIMNDSFRTLLSDYGTTISLVLWSVVPYLVKDRLDGEKIPSLFVPLSFGTTSGRGWLVDLTDISAAGIFTAIFPGLIITVLFFFDHNVSSIITQSEDMKLKKGSSFHWDFLVLGVTIAVTGILGLPPCNGLIPQAPLHAKSLTVKERVYDSVTGIPTDEFVVTRIYEQRVTNLAQGFLCGLVTFRPFSDALREIPNAVLYGLFLYLGYASFADNEFVMRMEMMVVEPCFRAVLKLTPHYADVSLSQVFKFTTIQAVCCAVIFGITQTEASVIFPVLIALLVILRLYLFPRVFSLDDLHKLDVAELSSVQTRVVEDCAFDAVEGSYKVDDVEAARMDMDEELGGEVPVDTENNANISSNNSAPADGTSISNNGGSSDSNSNNGSSSGRSMEKTPPGIPPQHDSSSSASTPE